MYMKYGERIVIVKYYNVLFYMIFRVGIDNLKVDCLTQMVDEGKNLRMRTIYDWCQKQHVPLKMKFKYRKDYSIKVNIWNLYSYCRFKWDMYREKLLAIWIAIFSRGYIGRE